MSGNLESSIYIYLVTAEPTIRSDFAGVGANRRRSTVVTRLLAEHLIQKLLANYTFIKNGSRVPSEELFGLLHHHLMTVPDDIAKASVARTKASEAASKAIARSLYLAMDGAFECVYVSHCLRGKADPHPLHPVAAA